MCHFEIWVCPFCGDTIKFYVLPDRAFNPRFCHCKYPEFLIEYKKVYEQ